MSESVATGLKLAAAVLITVGIITLGIVLFNQASGSAKNAQESFAGIEQEMNQQMFVAYDGTKVSGSTVTNALRKYKDDGLEGVIGIYVETGKNGAGAGTWYYQDASDPEALVDVPDYQALWAKSKDVKEKNYINASGQFKAELVFDSSNVVRAIKFTQTR